MAFEHKSVLLYETVDSLNIRPDGIYVDGTLGGGGHAYEVCRRLGEHGRLIGIDQDADAIAAATKRLEPFADKVTVVRSNYENIASVLHELGIEKVDGIYLDLGVSSYQLDTASRGFTYREDAPLDMRMDQRNTQTAADIVNTYSEMELYRIIRDYGYFCSFHCFWAQSDQPVSVPFFVVLKYANNSFRFSFSGAVRTECVLHRWNCRNLLRFR